MKSYHKDITVIFPKLSTFHDEVYHKLAPYLFGDHLGTHIDLKWAFEEENDKFKYPELYKYCLENGLFELDVKSVIILL